MHRLRWRIPRSILPAALMLSLTLAACAPVPVRRGPDAALLQAQAAREAVLAAIPGWSLTGRIAVSDGHDGGSGRIEWSQHGSDFDIRLSAPITRQSWRLIRHGTQVRLEGLDGGTREGDDAQALLQQAVGWVVPVDALAAWARGARSGPSATLEFGVDGLPALLDEQGWAVEYRAWTPGTTPALPKKVFASQGASHVRLQVDRWNADDNAAVTLPNAPSGGN
jgi:outer membrane lipoprotein LolB